MPLISDLVWTPPAYFSLVLVDNIVEGNILPNAWSEQISLKRPWPLGESSRFEGAYNLWPLLHSSSAILALKKTEIKTDQTKSSRSRTQVPLLQLFCKYGWCLCFSTSGRLPVHVASTGASPQDLPFRDRRTSSFTASCIPFSQSPCRRKGLTSVRDLQRIPYTVERFAVLGKQLLHLDYTN